MTRLRPALSVLALLTALALVGCESTVDAPAEQPLTAETKRATDVLPAGATFVSMVSAEQFTQGRSLPLPVDPKGENAARMRDFMEATGFDPARDVQDIYVAGRENGAMSLAAYVSMDRDKIRQAIEEQMKDEWARAEYGGLPVYMAQGGHAFAFALASDDLILAATDAAALRGMIDRLTGDGTEALADDAALMPLVRTVQGQGDAWLALRGVDDVFARPDAPDTESGRQKIQQINQLRRAVRDAAVAVTFGDDRVEGTAYLTAAADVNPADLANVVEGAIAALKASPQMDDTERKILGDARVQEQGNEVRVAFALPTSVMRGGRQ